MTPKAACASVVCVSFAACGTTWLRSPIEQSQDPSRFTYTRLFCSQDNESHFETVAADLGKVDGAPPAPPFFAQANPASRIVFVGFDRACGTQDLQGRTFHPAPAAQFVVYLQGTMSITVTDGETRRFGPGDVLRVEDTAPCRGHISVVGDGTSFTAISR